ncbi:histidine phosphatase family protein [Bacillus piscicola]|uniref:histidine phosphatase family protein n=1 Tax=Bacillus piscicola TaxID=1632684 RepID=UPI001F08D5F1|nr:histidine phosphatase family protein [Bacillus piscicola]
MDDQRTVYFLRHGVTHPNERRQYTGWSDPELVDGECRWLQRLAPYLEADQVFSSDLIRAKQTAACLFPSSPPSVSPSFRELYFGDFEGKTYEELKGNKAYQHWLDHIDSAAPLNGESLRSFQKRVQDGWELVKRRTDRRAAVVTHGGWIREWFRLYAPHFPEEKLWNIPFGGGWCGVFQVRGEEWECVSLQEVPITERKPG